MTIQRMIKHREVRGRKSPRCPLCGSEFEIKYVDVAEPFHACAALLIAVFLSFAFGARGPTLFLASIFGWIPVFFIVVFWTQHFAPPKLKPCSPDDPDYSGPLGLDSNRDRDSLTQ